MQPGSGLNSLDERHRSAFEWALRNILSTDVAEHTYAQILDGLPTEASLEDSYPWMESHPVYELGHKEICSGFIQKAREFRAKLDVSQLHFEESLLVAFQSTTPDSRAFALRLIELIVVACHQIAAFLYELDTGAHSHQRYREWREKQLQKSRNGVHPHGYFLPHTPFVHGFYQYPDQYPRGSADTVGYWAEGKIFGGVVVFERGETEKECNAMWLHGGLIRGPKTLYRPTEEQFNALTAFLLADSEHLQTRCPLPIHGTPMNRPRWGAYEAFVDAHIFRDRYERKVSSERPRRGCRILGIDWPESDDQLYLVMQSQARYQGEEVDEEAIKAAEERIMNITPSSPLWYSLYGRFEKDGS